MNPATILALVQAALATAAEAVSAFNTVKASLSATDVASVQAQLANMTAQAHASAAAVAAIPDDPVAAAAA